MNILIIGDSYAAQGSIYELDAEHSYQNILRKKYGFIVDNYGFPGHSLFKTYIQLNDCFKNINKYNLVIILITTHGRLYIPNCNIGIGSVGNAENLISRYENNNVPAEHKYPTLEQVKAARDYYKYLKDQTFENYVHFSIVDSIKLLLTDINHVLIPVNSLSLQKNESNWSLMNMTFKQLELFSNTPRNFSMDRYREIHGKILNHLTIENNHAFADFIYRRYNNSNEQFNEKVFKPAAIDDFFYYYEKI